ncbi:MAG: hypothetical protein N3A72_03325 [bacterium]|nr:hypothetical protein [bacterium]
MAEIMNISTIIVMSSITLITIGLASWSLSVIFRTMEFFLAKQSADIKK